MTTVLAFDTSQDWCSVSICKNGIVSAHSSTQMQAGHSQVLLPTILKIIEEANLRINEIDMILTITGPGSFTGLRVGIATAQGLGMALQIPVIGVNSFDAYASCIETNKSILVAIESQKQDIYCQLFNQNKQAIKQEVSINPKDILHYTQNEEFILTGSAIDKVMPALKLTPALFHISPGLLCDKLSLNADTHKSKKSEEIKPFYIKEALVTK